MQAPQSSSLFSQRSVQIGQIPSSLCLCLSYITIVLQVKVFTMVSVIVLMVSPPWGQSWRLAALSLLTINLTRSSCYIFCTLSFQWTCWNVRFSTDQVPGLLVAGRGILLEYHFQLTKCLACWSRPPDPKPESLLAADPRLSWAFRTLGN